VLACCDPPEQSESQIEVLGNLIDSNFDRNALAAYAHAGNNLIVEHILDNPDWLPELKELFQPFDVYFVGLHCDLEALKQREIARGDRPIGSAEQDFHSVHVDRVYDLEIRNTASTEHNVTAILEGWRSGIRKSEFATR
uniref:phosphotransferase-like protein n=1 Tax=Pseudovibrio sp. POLY-S9 TaxID=1576596 RepID=UPI000711262D